MRIVTLFFLLVQSLLGRYLPYKPMQVAPAPYDYFMFVQQWPGAFIKCYPLHQPKPPEGFGIHGLWPNFNNGSYPSNCNVTMNPFVLKTLNPIKTNLENQWPTWLCPASLSSDFWKHEWEKHGTCSVQVLKQLEYFQAALDLKTQYNLLSCLDGANILQGTSHQLNDFKKAIINCFVNATYPGFKQDSFYIQCNRNSELWQIWICVERAGKKTNPLPQAET